jgi:hypothetical protein
LTSQWERRLFPSCWKIFGETSATAFAHSEQCATVKLVLYSEKEPQKGDTRVVDPKVIQQIWQDFAPYRL